MVKQTIMNNMVYGKVPNLVELTKVCHQCTLKTVQSVLLNSVHTETADYVIITGTMIHGPRSNYFDLAFASSMINGVCKDVRQEIMNVDSSYELERIRHHISYSQHKLLNAASVGKPLELEDIITSHQKKNIDSVDYDGRTALHVACTSGKVRNVELLLSMGANCTIRDHFKNTAFECALLEGHSDVLQILSDRRGIKLDDPKFVKEHLFKKIADRDVVFVANLLRYSKDPESVAQTADYNKCTALELAHKLGYMEISQLLIARGATHEWQVKKISMGERSSAEL